MKRSIVLVLVTALLAVMALTVTPAANAQPIPIPATCTSLTTPPTPVACALQLIGFQGGPGGVVNAVFRLTNEVTGQVTRIVVPITQIPGATCTILDLTIGPIDLMLLGLRLQTNEINLLLTAQRGTLLGDLLCGIFFGNPLTAGLLSTALRQGLITL